MARHEHYGVADEAKQISEMYVQKFPVMFGDFRPEMVVWHLTKMKKNAAAIKVVKVGYPFEAYVGVPYIFEVFDSVWIKMNQAKKNMSVFRAMVSVPINGFDPDSKDYAKVLQPEIKMFISEFAACGGVPNWMENPNAADPLNLTEQDVLERLPIVSPLGDDEIVREPVTMNDLQKAMTSDEIS